MDADGFDILTRSMAVVGSRRGLLRRLAALPPAGVLAVLLGRDTTQAAGSGAIVGGRNRRRNRREAKDHDKRPKRRDDRLKCNRKPGECEQCQRGKCERKNGEKRCETGKIRAKANGTACSVGTCQDGTCQTPQTPQTDQTVQAGPPPADPLAGTCTATQADRCREGDTPAAHCNNTVGCYCFTRTNNTRFCGVDNDAYCPSSSTGCSSDTDCPGDDACVKILTSCNGCGPNNDEPFCIPPCGG